MPYDFADIARKRVWVVDVDAFFESPLAESATKIGIRRTEDPTNGLRSGLHALYDRGGDAYFYTRNADNVGKIFNLDLPIKRDEIAARIIDDHNLGDVKRLMNGAGVIPASDAVFMGSDPQMALDFSSLDIAVVWVDKRQDLNGVREYLVSRANITPITIPQNMFGFISRAAENLNNSQAVDNTFEQSMA